ncbi:MAG: type II toxin-antitoxin system RelE/ParE family toxin [Halopseudomonas aestusnigri]|nr:type II toxin-antitoxin system RelE/ParE family toxin [Halopseudomonas aestusnigri]
MPALHLAIAPVAKSDLREIYRFSLKQWGQAPADAYLDSLKRAFWSLIEHPQLGTDRTDILRGVRSISVGSHNVYYRIKTNNVEIIRVLHGRQDPALHLK